MSGETKNAKPMTTLLNEETAQLATFDVSRIPKQLLPVLDVEKTVALTKVRVDPLAVLKIVKHARESHPTSVNGQLLGLEINGVLEVTHAFPVPTQLGSEEDMTNYQIEMIQCLREVNVDSSSVGWYQSTRLGDFMGQPLLDVQASYQASPNAASSVVLIHDTTKSEQGGNLSLRAFRLSAAYLDLVKKGEFGTKDLAARGLTFANILEELPVQVEGSSLAKALVAELQWPATGNGAADQLLAQELQRPSSFNAKLRARRLADRSAVADDVADDDVAGVPGLGAEGLLPVRSVGFLGRPVAALGLEQADVSLARQLESMGELIDEHVHDANQWMYWKRGEAKVRNARAQFVERRKDQDEVPEKELDAMFRPLPEPSRLDALLNTANLSLLTKAVTQSRGPAMTKMYMAQALQQDN
ncbi:hypothetical protein IWW38_001504 [Coemansia aciculifera]|uniref:Uncharacterized protein n=1 Tax=Coemansia aciculifera TaxID=417176 RepID=A0ACC1M825_9FUNG|nr:hypothetical protein IWW38_001504 [Coemansia aciculifera]